MAFGISGAAWLAGAAVVGSAAISANSTKKASQAQQQSAQQANDSALTAQREAQAYQKSLDDRAYADNAPYRLAGTNALAQLAAAKDFTGADLASEPGYAFGLAEGNRALTNSAAARGGLLSGAALKASTKYAQDYAGTKLNDAFTRDQTNKNGLRTLAGIGQTSVGQTTSSGLQTGQSVGNGLMSTAQVIGNNITGAGNARASGYLANGNALTGLLNQGVSAWNNRNKLGDVPSSDYYANNDYLAS